MSLHPSVETKFSRPHSLANTLERIRLTTQSAHVEWLDLLESGWREYQLFKAGVKPLSQKGLENVARHFDLTIEQLHSGELDFGALAIRSQSPNATLPERYLSAAHGRRRASINAIDFLERHVGWRLRLDAVERFALPEAELRKPFAPISVHLMTDLCTYLKSRRFESRDYFAMGVHTRFAARGTIVERLFAEMRSLSELAEFFINESMKLFEENCRYQVVKLSPDAIVIDAISNPDVAAELGVRHIGSPELCQFKAGMLACLPQFHNLPIAEVRETKCVHRGDSRCRFEAVFPRPVTVDISQLS